MTELSWHVGGRDFVAGLSDHLRKHEGIPEIPKSQRYANRPGLDEIFSEAIRTDKNSRDSKIVEAVEEYGCTQRAVADHLDMHFTYVSQIINRPQSGPI